MKTSKILCLVLTLALLVIGAVAVTASAESTPTVKIASKNLSYDSNISIVFAVKAENTTVAPTLNVYTMEDGELSFKENVKATFTPENSLEKVGFADAYIFFTSGIVAKALDTQLYAEAVVTIDGVDYKSAIERYSVIEYCHEMNAQKSTDMYNGIIEYSALIQKMLEADGKFSGAYATDYKYVTIEGGTLDGTYDSGIYLTGDKVYPQADGAKAWLASDGTNISNEGEYVVSDANVSFTEVVGPKAGTETFESYYIGQAKVGGTVMEDTVYDAVSKVVKITSSATSNNTVYSTYSDANGRGPAAADADGYEISFDFKLEAGTIAPIYYLNFASKQTGSTKFVYKIKLDINGGRVRIANTKNSNEYMYLGDAGSYYNVTFRVVPSDDGNTSWIQVYRDGALKLTFKTQNETGNFTCSGINEVRLQNDTASASNTCSIYFDNLYIGYYKND